MKNNKNHGVIMRKALLYTLAIFSTINIFAQTHQIAEQVVAVVGNSMITLSDLDEMAASMAEERKKQGITSDLDPRCEALENMLMQKLLANQARLDSLETNSGQIDNYIDNHVNSLIEKYGSMKALEAAYKKPIYQLKDELKDKYIDMQLAQVMMDNVKSKVTIIPSEVEKFYSTLNKDSLPTIPEQYVYSQIVMYPASTTDAKLRAREKLLEMRERIIKGEKFQTLARMYSADPGSAAHGGEMDYMPANAFTKNFGDAIMKLKPGQISDVVETEFGFHIIELMDKKGDTYKVRHILIKPTYTSDELLVNSLRLDSLAHAIRGDSITFEKAAEKFSEDKLSKANKGLVTNHDIVELQQLDVKNTSTHFLKENISPADYNVIRKLKVGEVSESYQTTDIKGNELSKIVKLNAILPPHRANIKDDYNDIETLALETKKDKVFNTWLKKKMDAMYIRIDPRFIKCDFENKGWVK